MTIQKGLAPPSKMVRAELPVSAVGTARGAGTTAGAELDQMTTPTSQARAEIRGIPTAADQTPNETTTIPSDPRVRAGVLRGGHTAATEVHRGLVGMAVDGTTSARVPIMPATENITTVRGDRSPGAARTAAILNAASRTAERSRAVTGIVTTGSAIMGRAVRDLATDTLAATDNVRATVITVLVLPTVAGITVAGITDTAIINSPAFTDTAIMAAAITANADAVDTDTVDTDTTAISAVDVMGTTATDMGVADTVMDTTAITVNSAVDITVTTVTDTGVVDTVTMGTANADTVIMDTTAISAADIMAITGMDMGVVDTVIMDTANAGTVMDTTAITVISAADIMAITATDMGLVDKDTMDTTAISAADIMVITATDIGAVTTEMDTRLTASLATVDTDSMVLAIGVSSPRVGVITAGDNRRGAILRGRTVLGATTRMGLQVEVREADSARAVRRRGHTSPATEAISVDPRVGRDVTEEMLANGMTTAQGRRIASRLWKASSMPC